MPDRDTDRRAGETSPAPEPMNKPALDASASDRAVISIDADDALPDIAELDDTTLNDFVVESVGEENLSENIGGAEVRQTVASTIVPFFGAAKRVRRRKRYIRADLVKSMSSVTAPPKARWVDLDRRTTLAKAHDQFKERLLAYECEEDEVSVTLGGMLIRHSTDRRIRILVMMANT